MNTFKTKLDILAVSPPKDKATIHLKHFQQPGLYVRVGRPQKKGGKVTRSYIVRYSTGSKSTGTIGEVDEMSVTEAVAAAREMLRANAIKAAEVRKQKKSGAVTTKIEKITLAVAWNRFKTEHAVGAPLKVTTVRDYESKLKHMLKDPKFSELFMEDLDNNFWFDRYKEVLHRSRDAKRLYATAAKQFLRTVSALYEFLLDINVVKSNPVKAIRTRRLTRVKVETRDVIPENDIKKFMNDVLTKSQSPQREFIIFMLFTGFRLSLMGSLNFSRVDFDMRAYMIKPEDIGSKKIAHEILYPIPDYVWDTIVVPKARAKGFLDGTAKPTSTDWIFESPKRPGQPLVSVRGSFGAINGRTGVRAQSHPMRRTLATIGAKVVDGFSISRILAHSQTSVDDDAEKVTALYVVSLLLDIREALDKVAERILELAEIPYVSPYSN